MRNKFLWQVLNGVSIAAINIIFVMIMARYIPKEIHGVYAILITINNFFLMFSQFGLGAGLVQKLHIEKSDINNAFFINLSISSFIYLLLFFSANNISVFFDNKINTLDIRLLGLTLLLSCFSAISMSLLQRDFAYKKIFLINFSSYFISYILVGSLLAIIGLEIKAFIYAQISLQILLSTISYLTISFKIIPNYFSLKNSSFLLKFGKELTLIQLLSFASGKIDKLIFGKIISLTSLANFEKAQYLTFLPSRFLNMLTNGFLFSLFAKYQNNNTKLFKLYASITGLIMLVILQVSFFFIVSSTLIIELFYGNNWLSISPFIKYFAISSPFIILAGISDALVRAKNNFKFSIYIKTVYGIAVILSSLSALYLRLEIVVIIQVIVTILYALLMNQTALNTIEESFINFCHNFKAFGFSTICFLIGFLILNYFHLLNLNYSLIIYLVVNGVLLIFNKVFFSKEQRIIFFKLIIREGENNNE